MHRPVQRKYAVITAYVPRASRGEKIPLLDCKAAFACEGIAICYGEECQGGLRRKLRKCGNAADK